MENKTKLSIGAVLTLVLAMSGTYFVADGDNAYYCNEKDIVMICEKFSGGIGSRCYYEDTYKICKLGWEKIELGQEISGEVPAQTEGNKWQCSPTGCVRVE